LLTLKRLRPSRPMSNQVAVRLRAGCSTGVMAKRPEASSSAGLPRMPAGK
jgi:hypothetical protein